MDVSSYGTYVGIFSVKDHSLGMVYTDFRLYTWTIKPHILSNIQTHPI